MKASHVCLVILANFCLSTLALPALVKEDSEQLDPDLRDNTPQSKRDVSFGTALGHKKKSDYNNDREDAFKKIFGKRGMSDLKREYYSDYMNDWLNEYNTLYPDNDPQDKRTTSLHSAQQKRAPFTFGTALGHGKGKNNPEYVNSLNAKFNELFGDK